VLQGSLIIDESAFVELFPSEAGYKFFLVDTPEGQAEAVAEVLATALEDYGLESVGTVERLNRFNAVQNT
jgi:putative ABC transport system permease protein